MIFPEVKRFLSVVSLAIVAGAALVVAGLRAIESRLIYFPPRYPEGFPAPQTYAGEIEDVWFTTADGVKINAFYRAYPESRQVLLWFHGNAENIGYNVDHIRVLARLGVNILAVDYRGYGRSEGKPDEAGVYRDADAAYEYLVTQRHFRAEDIIIYGHSLGGAVAVNLASRRLCGGLIMQSSFTSVREMAKRAFAVSILAYVAKSRFDSLGLIPQVHAPILIAHGTQDDVVPFAMGQQLYAAAPEPKRFYAIEGAGHNNMLGAGGKAYLECLKEFVQTSARTR